MKKCLILITTILLCSCTHDSPSIYRVSDNYSRYQMITLEYEGNFHEYVKYKGIYRGGISHWEDCKYCKQRKMYEETK